MSFDNLISIWPIWLGLILVASIAAVMFFRARNHTDMDFSVQRKSRLLSSAERTFLDTVVDNLGDDFYVFAKVSLLDVIEATPGSTKAEVKKVRSAFDKHVLDYVICKKQDLSIFGVIELENFEKNPNLKKRKARESIIGSICKQAHLRLFYFDVRQNYEEVDLYRLVTGRSRKSSTKKSSDHSQLSVDAAEDRELTRLKSCPKCHSDVVTKVAIKGDSIGEKFLMCRKYPYCDYQVPVEEAQRSQAIEAAKQRKQAQSTGFKDWA